MMSTKMQEQYTIWRKTEAETDKEAKYSRMEAVYEKIIEKLGEEEQKT